MSKKTFRQLVNENNWTPQQEQEMMQRLGVKSGGEMVDENDPKLQQRQQAPRPQQVQASGGNGAPVMFQEVAGELQEKLEPVAKRIRVQSHQHLRTRVADLIMNTPLSEVEEETPNSFDFFSVVDGQNFSQWTGPTLGGSSSATPQLEASNPSSPILTTPSKPAQDELPQITPPSQT